MANSLHDAFPNLIETSDYCSAHNYHIWERDVAKPHIEAAGYRHVTFHMGEADSFGPLSRIVRAIGPDGEKKEWMYG